MSKSSQVKLLSSQCGLYGIAHNDLRRTECGLSTFVFHAENVDGQIASYKEEIHRLGAELIEAAMKLAKPLGKYALSKARRRTYQHDDAEVVHRLKGQLEWAHGRLADELEFKGSLPGARAKAEQELAIAKVAHEAAKQQLEQAVEIVCRGVGANFAKIPPKPSRRARGHDGDELARKVATLIDSLRKCQRTEDKDDAINFEWRANSDGNFVLDPLLAVLQKKAGYVVIFPDGDKQLVFDAPELLSILRLLPNDYAVCVSVEHNFIGQILDRHAGIVQHKFDTVLTIETPPHIRPYSRVRLAAHDNPSLLARTKRVEVSFN